MDLTYTWGQNANTHLTEVSRHHRLFRLFRPCASHFEPEDWVTGASVDHPSPPQHQRGLNDIALVETSFFSFSLCNIHLCINTSRGIFSILPYGQQLLFLPGCHLFSCYFFDFIFKQYNMENSNTECRTDGEQIQITDFQSHPNTSDRRGVGGIKPDCWIAKSKQISINHKLRGERRSS